MDRENEINNVSPLQQQNDMTTMKYQTDYADTQIHYSGNRACIHVLN